VLKEGPTKNLLPRLGTRREYFDYLDRWTVGTVDKLRTHMTTRALVKAFLLETSRFNGSRDALAALGSLHQEIAPVDDTLYRLRWRGEESD
jgi:thymidine phosphorylase